MAEKKLQICITLKPDLIDKLTKMAAATGRTRSGLVGWILEKSFRTDSYVIKCGDVSE